MGIIKILAIDHAKVTGFSIVIDGLVIYTGTKEFDYGSNGKDFEFFSEFIESLIQCYKPDIICCEFPADMTGARTARKLIGYYTIILLHAAIHNITIEECYPSSVRKTLTGDGNATKEKVFDILIEKYKIHREMIEEPVYYIKPYRGKPAGALRHYLYNKSDSVALAFYYIEKHKAK